MFYINLPHIIQINTKLQHTSQKKTLQNAGFFI